MFLNSCRSGCFCILSECFCPVKSFWMLQYYVGMFLNSCCSQCFCILWKCFSLLMECRKLLQSADSPHLIIEKCFFVGFFRKVLVSQKFFRFLFFINKCRTCFIHSESKKAKYKHAKLIPIWQIPTSEETWIPPKRYNRKYIFHCAMRNERVVEVCTSTLFCVQNSVLRNKPSCY